MTRLIERYRASMTEQVKRELSFRVIPQAERLATEISLESCLTGLSISEKYLFSQSAFLFHKEMLDQRIRASGKGDISWKAKLPELPIWIEGEGSVIETGMMQAQGLFLNNHYHPEVLKRSKFPLVHDSDFRQLLDLQDEWYCDLVGTDGKPVFSMTVSSAGDWTIGEGHRCPFGRCTFPAVCDECKAHMVFWAFWIVIALLMIEGNFATSPDLAEYPEVVETVRRKVERKGGNPKKKKHVEERQVWHLITFDACLKKPGPSTLAVENEPHEARGAWLKEALELDPDGVIYLDKHIAPSSRTLRHPRFTKMQGKTIEVKGHDKRIPVKVKELMSKITRVVASKYEEK